jgi:hypothetical protein
MDFNQIKCKSFFIYVLIHVEQFISLTESQGLMAENTEKCLSQKKNTVIENV